jgi:hypothetical protein
LPLLCVRSFRGSCSLFVFSVGYVTWAYFRSCTNQNGEGFSSHKQTFPFHLQHISAQTGHMQMMTELYKITMLV